MHIFKSFFIALVVFFGSSISQAQFAKSGEIRLYANAMPSSQLNADVARQYGIARSASRVLLHVVVREGTPGKDKTLPAKITAVAIRKNGERTLINMQTTSEGQDVYYLGEMNISGNEGINFEVTAQIEKQKPMRTNFYQQFNSQ